MKTALRVNSDFTTEVLDLGCDCCEYTQLSTAVGGYIQHVPLSDGLTIWVNEEGKLSGLPINLIATRVWETHFGVTDIIVGDCVFTGGIAEDGESLPLAQDFISKLEETAAVMRSLYEGQVRIASII
jgi:hypothetical protein